MSLGLTKTKHRIISIENTEKTTKAMGLIAMVKLKHFLDEYNNTKRYNEEFVSTMGTIISFSKIGSSTYSKINEDASKSLYIVISSNLGLCGAYNNQLFKFVDKYVSKDDVIAPIGSKGFHHFSHSDNFKNISNDYMDVNLSLDKDVIRSFADKLKKQYDEKKYRSINIIYTRYINSLKNVPTSFRLLPIQIPNKKWDGDEYCPPEFDEDPNIMLNELLPLYLETMIYGKLVESQLSEQASRRTAMDNANDNADELLEKLRIEYNKARQTAITQEINEVVGGANANE